MGQEARRRPRDIRQMISQRYGPLADRALAAYGLNGAERTPARSGEWNRDDAVVPPITRSAAARFRN